MNITKKNMLENRNKKKTKHKIKKNIETELVALKTIDQQGHLATCCRFKFLLLLLLGIFLKEEAHITCERKSKVNYRLFFHEYKRSRDRKIILLTTSPNIILMSAKSHRHYIREV